MNQHKESKALFKKACELMPGGVSSPVRAFRSVGGSPIYYKKASGACFVDVDDNEYIDFCMSWGPLILGHAHPQVIEAVRKTATDGLTFGACCRQEVELAEMVLSAFLDMQQVRFVSSGTEAVMTAIRLARGVTGRSKILKFEGGYHGHSDSLLVKAGSGLVTFGTSSSQGVPESVVAHTLVCPLNEESALEQAFQRHGKELAAVVVEPLPGNNGLLEQRPEWLQTLRRLTEENGALLIFDEVISGFRTRFGGYGDAVGVPADLITLGKIIGGGMPVGAICGPRKMMERLAPLGDVYQAGTLSGNPVALAAGLATLKILAVSDVYERLEELGQELELALASARRHVPFLNWRRIGSLLWFHLAEGQVPRAAGDIDPGTVEKFNRVHGSLLQQGVYLPPSAYEVLFLSAAHTKKDVSRLAIAFAKSLVAD
jgi:glutamate-1-semialdehyde 2,1-aminomutase